MLKGVALILAGLAIALSVGVVLRTRLPRVASLGLLVVSGVAVGAGALLVQEQASGVEWALTLISLGFMVPFQVRLIFGRLGRTAAPRSGKVVPD
jgi:hypothetical protein